MYIVTKQKLQPSRKSIEKLTEKEHSKLSFEQPLNDAESPDEIVNRLIDTTKTLSERQKTILNKYRDDRTNKEIAHTYGLTSQTVRHILYKSVQKIKEVHNQTNL